MPLQSGFVPVPRAVEGAVVYRVWAWSVPDDFALAELCNRRPFGQEINILYQHIAQWRVNDKETSHYLLGIYFHSSLSGGIRTTSSR